jgi:hypothetical protein
VSVGCGDCVGQGTWQYCNIHDLVQSGVVGQQPDSVEPVNAPLNMCLIPRIGLMPQQHPSLTRSSSKRVQHSAPAIHQLTRLKHSRIQLCQLGRLLTVCCPCPDIAAAALAFAAGLQVDKKQQRAGYPTTERIIYQFMNFVRNGACDGAPGAWSVISKVGKVEAGAMSRADTQLLKLVQLALAAVVDAHDAPRVLSILGSGLTKELGYPAEPVPGEPMREDSCPSDAQVVAAAADGVQSLWDQKVRAC